MSTPTFDYEQVRKLIVDQVQGLVGFIHARHLFDGVKAQGAVIGERTFDVKTEGSRPLTSARSGAERLEVTYRIRLRHKASLLQGAQATTRAGLDRRAVEQRLRARGYILPTAIQIAWVSTAPPAETVKGFLDTDILITASFWSVVVTVPEASGAAAVL